MVDTLKDVPLGTRVLLVGFEDRGPGVVVPVGATGRRVRHDRPLRIGFRSATSYDVIPNGHYDGYLRTTPVHVLGVPAPDDNTPDD